MLAKQNLASRTPSLQSKVDRQWLKGLKLEHPVEQIMDSTLGMFGHYEEQIHTLEKQVI